MVDLQLRQHGPASRVTVQLEDARSGALAWAEQFECFAPGAEFGRQALSSHDGVVQRTVAVLGDLFGVLAGAVWRRSRRQPVRQLTACEAVVRNLQYQSHLADAMYPDALRAAFSLVPEYLRTPDEVASLSEYGPALGRAFRALQLWAVLRCYGREGLQAAIRNAVSLAEAFEGWVRDEPGWELCAPRPFSVVCFRREGSDEDNAALLERVNARGEVFLSHTKLDGRYVLRLAVGNLRTTEDDVQRAWDVLREEAA